MMKNSSLDRYQLPLIGVVLAIVFASLTYWAGYPREKFAIFALGTAALIGGMALFGVVLWHLLIRPLPAGVEKPALALQPVTHRRLISVFLTVASMGTVIGGFWDEVWHRAYGFPFGPDLFWRPHIIIYLSLLTPPLLAIYGVYTLLKKGKGNLQQRFRADPVSGLLVLAGAFLMYTVPADPLWHTVYGEDISAWSLPHIMLLFSVTLIALLAIYIQLTTLPERKWSSLARVKLPELFPVAALSFGLLIQLQVLATDWENGNTMLTRRPEWLLPVIFASLTALMGGLAVRGLRRWGAATLVGVIALLIRFSLIRAFDYSAITIQTWLPILPPLVALDTWYAIKIHNQFSVKNGARWVGILGDSLAVLAGLLGSLFLISRTFDYPLIAWPGVVEMGLAGLIAAFTGGWISDWLSSRLSANHKQVEEKGFQPGLAFRLAPLLTFSVVVLSIALFIITAIPPA